ncbi:nitroreductase/quinone reductase family protein [Phenylobacterium sp. LjRoot225]|uniref:nitroreductase/quinone reductase family protein n=1 Tax=Phenylobacterium sp. LjRoot225 TaxID=3342285 RepID=UPI003ECE4AF2
MTSQEGADELLARTQEFVADHLARYLASGGADGHIEDFSHVGVPGMLPTLLLKTTGRRSGRSSVVPLLYGVFGGEWVVIASKGGAPEHPAWFLNLLEQGEAVFQIATQEFRGAWRVAEGQERARVWSYMAGLYPPYTAYEQSAGDRVIPVVMLKPVSGRRAEATAPPSQNA